jgi:hypothetical protein
VIRRFGILNTLVPEDDHPWFGMPFPGVYVTDDAGIITAKLFENHLALRPTVEQLLRSTRGQAVEPDAGRLPSPAEAVQEVVAEVSVSRDPLAPGLQRDLIVRLHVPEGQHLQGEPVPSGMVATAVEFDEGVIALNPVVLASREHTLDGTGEVLQVYDGDRNGVVEIVIPFAISGGLVDPEGTQTATVAGRVLWQACDDHTCGLPQRHEFEFVLPVASMVTPHTRNVYEGQMDFAAHFQRMRERHG